MDYNMFEPRFASKSSPIKFIIISLIFGIVATYLTYFIKDCGSNVDGVDCKYINDVIFSHGLPLKYFKSGGIAGIHEFNLAIFIVDIIFWSVLILLLLHSAQHFSRSKLRK